MTSNPRGRQAWGSAEIDTLCQLLTAIGRRELERATGPPEAGEIRTLLAVPCGQRRRPAWEADSTGFLRRLRNPEAAGIPKENERGQMVDVHALRHTFGTHLSKNGVAPPTAQAAMRHSSLDLTMNVYTDPSLLDVAGALNALPALSLDGARQAKEAE